MMRVAEECGLRPRFLGARREEGEGCSVMEFGGLEVERIGRPFPLVDGRRPLVYVWSVVRYLGSLMRRLGELGPVLVHVSDFPLYWGARLYTAVRRIPLIYNIHDNLGQCYRVPRMVAWILNVAEGVAALSATVTVVPEGFRRAALPRWARSNVRVVRNTPIDPGYSEPIDRDPGKVTLFVGGWIDAGRGIRQLATMVRSRVGSLKLVLAGRGDARLLAELASREGVEACGYVSHEEVIAMTVQCDYVCALYDPARPINRYAASNKIAEALAVGRPLLINRELEIARLLAPYECTICVAYDDVRDVGRRLLELRANVEEYRSMCVRARRAYEDHYSWHRVRDEILGIFESVGIR